MNGKSNKRGIRQLNGEIRRRIFAIAALAVILRVIVVLIWGGWIEETVYEYDIIARNIVAGLGFSFDMYGDNPVAPTAWMAPFYPYLLAGYYWLVGEDLLGMAILQALTAGLVCCAIGSLGVIISGAGVGLTAALIFAVYPEMVFLPLKFVAESWLLLWLLLFVLFGAKYIEEGKRWYIVLAGILAGLASLTRVFALACPFALLAWIWFKVRPSRRLLADSLILLLVTACVIAPWTIRNYRVFGRFIPVRTNFWVNVWRGNYPGATGTPRNQDKILHDLVLDQDYRAIIDPQLVGDEIQREGVYRKLALQHIAEDPVRYIGLTLRRLFYFWTIDPTHPLAGHPIYWAPWFALLILAGVGIISVRQSWHDYSFWYLLFVISTLVFSLTLVLPRYRIPLLPGLMLLAAEGVHTLVCSRGKTKNV